MSALADSDATARAPTQLAVKRRAVWPGAVYRWVLLSAAALAVVVLGATCAWRTPVSACLVFRLTRLVTTALTVGCPLDVCSPVWLHATVTNVNDFVNSRPLSLSMTGFNRFR